MKNIPDEVTLREIDCNLYDFIKDHSPFQDTDEVFSYSGISYDYKRFKDLVEKNIRILSSLPYLSAGDKVVIGLLTCPESIALLYACNYISLVPLMVDVRLSNTEYRRIITEADAKIAFLADLSSRNLKNICKAPCLKHVFILSPIESGSFPARFFWGWACFFMGFRYMFSSRSLPNAGVWSDYLKLDPGEGIYGDYVKGDGDTTIIFATSGSTGQRKFVMQTSRALNLNIYYNEYYFDFWDKTITSELTFLPIFTCAGFASSIHLPLFYGKKLLIHQVYDFRKIEKSILALRPNIIIGSVGMWEHFLHSPNLGDADLSFLRFILYSGEKIESERIEKLNCILEAHGCTVKLMQTYGMTELTIVAMHTPETYNISSAGKPFPMTDVIICEDGTDQEVSVGEVGEICVNSIGMMKGYWLNEEATAKMLHVHANGKTYLHTGDLGYMDRDGYLFINGRIKNMHVSISGTKIYTPDLENEVMKFEGVSRCAACVCKPPGRNDVTEILLFMEMIENFRLKKGFEHKVKSYCYDNLPMFLVPDKVIVLKQMPLTPSGKIDYQTLQQQADSYVLKHRVTVINVK